MPYEEDKLSSEETIEESGAEKSNLDGPIEKNGPVPEPTAEPGAGPGSSRHEAAKKIEELLLSDENGSLVGL